MINNPYAVEQDLSPVTQRGTTSEQILAIAKYQLGFFYCLMAVVAVIGLAVIWEVFASVGVNLSIIGSCNSKLTGRPAEAR